MSRNVSVERVLSEGEQIARVWADNPSFTLGDVTLPQLQAMLDDLRNLRKQTEDLRTQLTALLNDTNAKSRAVTTVVTRARSGFRATFGPDSTQYEEAGGTRTSERKRPKRKSNT